MQSNIFILVASLLCAVGTQALTTRTSCGSLPSDSKIPNPKNCSQYLYCKNGNLQTLTCPQDYEYNQLQARCAYNPKCWSDVKDITDTHPSAENPCAGRSDGIYLPSPLSCRLFYYCMNNMSLLRSCPEGYAFSSLDSVCVQKTTNCS
ncbi:unnamed protein product [Hermetia illucens]|uniref:Chitin-binding type-2 domain-containing protein n=1 Tax=Hermetia illucens TaxID=343691 RepID=A0A7R8UGY2_HERIL|nr:peritrophin-44-like [Hermetia illucens]CAD7080683.1 unnamed protein product [Hermetia illucens]